MGIGELKEKIMSDTLELNAGTSTCPICLKFWLVTPQNDCCMPACGCYGSDAGASNTERPCERCGTRHAFTCEKMPSVN